MRVWEASFCGWLQHTCTSTCMRYVPDEHRIRCLSMQVIMGLHVLASLPPHRNASGALLAALATQTLADDDAIDRLFAARRCRHAYVDVGTNIGVQIRKLYEPHKYPGSPILERFEEAFGRPPWCDVCAIGIEPNPEHSARLDEVEERLRRANAEVLIFRAAASTAASATRFQAVGGEMPWVRKLHLVATMVRGASGYDSTTAQAGQVEVRTLDLARLVHRVGRILKQQHGGHRGRSKLLLKLDIEGAEYQQLMHLIMTQALCTIDVLFAEWHKPSAVSRHRAAASGEPDDAAAGVELVANLTRDIRGLVSSALDGRRTDCRTRLSLTDDEKYYKDGKPWPEAAVCP